MAPLRSRYGFLSPWWRQVELDVQPHLARVHNLIRTSPALRGKQLCIACPFALDFEAAHVQSWVAYHTLLGVDCFLLLLDMRTTDLSRQSTRRSYESLLRVPSIIALYHANFTEHAALHERLAEALAAEVPSAMRMVLGDRAPRYSSYLDSDEYLVHEDAPTQPTLEPCAAARSCTPAILAADAHGHTCNAHMIFEQQEYGDTRREACRKVATKLPTICGACMPSSTTEDEAPLPLIQAPLAAKQRVPRSVLPLLDGLLSEGVPDAAACGAYMHVWHYGFSDDPTPDTIQDTNASLPRFAVQVRRSGGAARGIPEFAGRHHGKMIVRVGSSIDLYGMHHWRSVGPWPYDQVPDGNCWVRLPNGTIWQKGSSWMLGEDGRGLGPVITWQPLSINHYIATSVAACKDKANRTYLKSGGSRSAPECLKTGKYHSTVLDPVLAAYAEATHARVAELFESI